jgi:multidrug efflux pump subunit AcrA (membrane-fusion protein)
MSDQQNNTNVSQHDPSAHASPPNTDSEGDGQHYVAETNIPDHAGADRPIPRGPHLGYLLLGLVLIAAALWAGVAFHHSIRDGVSTAQAQVVAAFAKPSQASEGTSGTQYYQGPMHPWIIQPKKGTCPICGMDLVPIDPDKLTGEVAIDPRVVQNMGVSVEQVTRGPLTRTVRTVGTVDYDETEMRNVNIKVNGWIEGLHVDSTGQYVEQGEPLFDLYSPELYAAQEELLLAHDSPSGQAGSLLSGDDGEQRLLGAARTRLLYYDITPDQIEALLKRGAPKKTMTIQSPHEGTVVSKHANDGMRVTPGMRVYQIADLSQVWVMATVYEYQLPYVQEGQAATMTLPYLPGETFKGEVEYIYPYMDSKTREVKVRLVFDNPDGQLKPGMFANVRLKDTIAQQAVLAPREAVIDTGQRQVALVSAGGGTFEPRDVRLGPTTGDNRVQILEGLKPGENVVTSGQFLIDSEAKMRAALAKMVKGNQPASTQQAERSGQAELSHIPKSANAPLADAVAAYLTIADQLANDRFETAFAATQLDEALNAFQQTFAEAHPDMAKQTASHVQQARQAAQQLAAKPAIKQGREVTAGLSRAFAELLKLTGTPAATDAEIVQFHCPMYQDDQGGTPWLQAAGEPRNPYYGSKMLRCHDTKQALPDQSTE